MSFSFYTKREQYRSIVRGHRKRIRCTVVRRSEGWANEVILVMYEEWILDTKKKKGKKKECLVSKRTLRIHPTSLWVSPPDLNPGFNQDSQKKKGKGFFFNGFVSSLPSKKKKKGNERIYSPFFFFCSIIRNTVSSSEAYGPGEASPIRWGCICTRTGCVEGIHRRRRGGGSGCNWSKGSKVRV